MGCEKTAPDVVAGLVQEFARAIKDLLLPCLNRKRKAILCRGHRAIEMVAKGARG